MKETNSSIDVKLRYISPRIKEIPVNVKNMLCQSGNKSLREYDYGDGGFGEKY